MPLIWPVEMYAFDTPEPRRLLQEETQLILPQGATSWGFFVSLYKVSIYPHVILLVETY